MKPLPCVVLGWLAVACAGAGAEISWTSLAGGNGAPPETVDGTGSQAWFSEISSVAVDGDGALYVPDAGLHTIRKITPAGVVTAMAGQLRTAGGADGTGTAAQFSAPRAVARGGDGTLYVADTGNSTIRTITVGGVVGTLAGTPGVLGTADGTGSAAQFRNPRGVAVDGKGVVYVADTGNHTIRKITPAGVVTTLAGVPGAGNYNDGTGLGARFRNPRGLATDSNGLLYIADTDNHAIRKMTAAGTVTTLAGIDFPDSPAWLDGIGTAARFSSPSGVAVDAEGTVFVADQGNRRLRKITNAGVVTTVAGNGDDTPGWVDGTAYNARFQSPQGVAVGPSGLVCVADSVVVRQITPGAVVTTLAGGRPLGGPGNVDGTGLGARFYYPNGLAIDAAGDLYVADQYNYSTRKVTSAGAVTTLAAFVSGSLKMPQGVAVDGNGLVYVAIPEKNLILSVTPAGVVSTLAGSIAGIADGTGTAARFKKPSSLATAPGGLVYVADSDNSTIRRIAPGAVVTTLAGLPQVPGSLDGTGLDARFSYAAGVATDPAGNVYVADTANSTIRKVTPDGEVTTLAGLAGTSGGADGTGTEARFWGPQGLAVDHSGNVIVGDYANHTIRRITPAGVVTTIGGVATQAGAREGIGTAARFYEPSSIAVGPGGRIYVTDRQNHRLMLGTPLYTNITEWRQGWFGTTADTGPAASLADPESDGIPNRIEFALGLNPLGNSAGELPQGKILGSDFVLEFTQVTALTGITLGAEWTPSLEAASWTPVPDTGGSATQHSFHVPLASQDTIFMRLIVTEP